MFEQLFIIFCVLLMVITLALLLATTHSWAYARGVQSMMPEEDCTPLNYQAVDVRMDEGAIEFVDMLAPNTAPIITIPIEIVNFEPLTGERTDQLHQAHEQIESLQQIIEDQQQTIVKKEKLRSRYFNKLKSVEHI